MLSSRNFINNFMFIMVLVGSTTTAKAGTYVTLYSSTNMTSGNNTRTYSNISTTNYTNVQMSYTVDLSSAFAGYTAPPFFSGSWNSTCNGTTMRTGNNSNNNGVPAPGPSGGTTVTDNVSTPCGNRASFSVTLTAAGWGVSVSMGNLTVQGYKDNPIANTQAAVSTNQNTPTAQTQLSVSDPQNAALTVVVVSSPTKGTLSWSGTKFIYTPSSCTTGADSFQYYVREGVANQTSATRTITINVNKVDNPPTITNISNVNMNWYERKTIALSGIAKGTCGGTISVTVSSGNEQVVIVPTISYTNPNTTATLTLAVSQPIPRQTSVTTITVTVNDGYNNPVSKTFNSTVQWVALMHR